MLSIPRAITPPFMPPNRTAKVWKDFQLLHDLVGHQQSVWTVLAIDGSQYLTGASRLATLARVTQA